MNEDIIVVELFTSQGCAACPPADEILSRLKDQDHILALSYSVEYWNYLGWKDTFAQPSCSIRQKKYNESLGKNGIYTPQMIIQGTTDLIGSKGEMADQIIETVRQKLNKQTQTGPKITFDFRDDMINLRISAGQRGLKATIWIMGYDFKKIVAIKDGELNGQVREYNNVVQSIKRVGSWQGDEIKLSLSQQDIGQKKYDAYAIILQQNETGPIIAAAKLRLNDE